MLTPVIEMLAVQLMAPVRQAMLQLGLLRATVRGRALPPVNGIGKMTSTVEVAADARLQLPYRALKGST